MNQEQRMVQEWHRKFGVHVQTQPAVPDQATMRLRVSLIQEEYEEFVKACQNSDLVGVADALADLLYVVYGSAVSFGIDLEPVFAEVHSSNMSKGDPEVIRAPNGKVLKSSNFRPPLIGPILSRQAQLALSSHQ